MTVASVVVLRGDVQDTRGRDGYGHGDGYVYGSGSGSGTGYGHGRGSGDGYSAPSLSEGTK